MNDKKNEALNYLTGLSKNQGYVSFDDIINSSEKYALPIQDVDWLSGLLIGLGILIKENKEISDSDSDKDDYIDFAHNDYDEVFNRAVELDGSLRTFIEKVKEIRPPQWHEVAQLKYQVLEGNNYARKRMIEMHLRLAVKIALQRSETYDLDINDEIGYSCIGLINAVDHYNPDSNDSFSSYAALRIYQVLEREMPTRRPGVYYPAHCKERYCAAYPIIKSNGCLECGDLWYCDRLRKKIMDKTECTPEQAEEVVNACIPFEHLDMFFENDDVFDNEEPGESKDIVNKQYLMKDEDIIKKINEADLHNKINDLLNTLKPRERDVIIARYGLDGSGEKTLEEVGFRFGVTRERIRQIEVKAIRRLRHPSRSREIKDYYYE